VIGAVLGGGIGAFGAGAGVALVLASYVASTLAIAWADSVAPKMVLGVGVGMYVLKFSLFGIMLVLLVMAGWPGRVAMAWGIIAGVIAWTASQIWWTTRRAYPNDRPYAFIPPERPEPSHEA
jgi:hypothetical protein